MASALLLALVALQCMAEEVNPRANMIRKAAPPAEFESQLRVEPGGELLHLPPAARRSRSRAGRSQMMHMTAAGDMEPVSLADVADSEAEMHMPVLSSGDASVEEADFLRSVEMDFCDEDYVPGLVNSNNCTDEANHLPVLRSEMCRHAAEKAKLPQGRASVGAPFDVDLNYYDKYPRGCFKETGTNAYFLNTIGDWPTHPVGTPICHRRRFTNGTADSNTGCPDGYTNIMDENVCFTAASCRSACISEEFRVGMPPTPTRGPPPYFDERPPDDRDPEIYNKRPHGCFIHPVDKCIYFNVPRAAPPTDPKGIPVCVPKS